MKFENTEVFNFEGAIRGARNPLESWKRSDSFLCSVKGNCEGCRFWGNDEECYAPKNYDYIIGSNDLKLMQSLIKAGSDHRKFMRQIFASVDITAPLYWWKEFSTYKVGTVANSTSTMHKLASTPITKDCFEMGDFEKLSALEKVWEFLIYDLECLRNTYNETKDKRYWKELIRLLPESWLQTRTVTMNYENILNMVRARKHHKLTEWSDSFINWAKTLPYADELLFLGEKADEKN